jgi:hypothetical protein
LKPSCSQSQTFEPVFAARPEPVPMSLRLCAARGRENGWEVASGDAGWATGWVHRRWKRTFDNHLEGSSIERYSKIV